MCTSRDLGQYLTEPPNQWLHNSLISVDRNVQVTFQILAALIEKLPRDLPLYASYILHILSHVLRSQDIGMVEDSIPVFKAFCAHQDIATLAADQEHVTMYESVVQLYAQYAARNPLPDHRPPLTQPQAIRYRAAGLRAIASVASSEAVGADGGKQLHTIMDMILDNLHPMDMEYLASIYARVETNELGAKDREPKRRLSVSTVQPVDANEDGENAAMSTSTDNADRLAEEEVGKLAMQSLKSIFMANSRIQIRLATTALLGFICRRCPDVQQWPRNESRARSIKTWTTLLVEIITRWAPVQDRFVILVTAVESLGRSPNNEESLSQQYVLLDLIGWLLRSDLSMVGLSVMDVLLGLIQRILLLLRLGDGVSGMLPLHEHAGDIDLFQATPGTLKLPSTARDAVAPNDRDKRPVDRRQGLLDELQACVGDLATHIYYSDQVSDILSAILVRLKSSPTTGTVSTSGELEALEVTVDVLSSSLRSKNNPEDSFSFGTARVLALKAVRQVLVTANVKSSRGDNLATGRSRVGIHVWEGTQWLIADSDRRVRRAYAEALLTWLELELSPGDLRVMEDKRKLTKGSSAVNLAKDGSNISPKAAINPQQRKPAKSSFLQLLHLAIYDKTLEPSTDISDLALFHLLLTRTVVKLGVNAVKTGLPMMLRLQEDINDDLLVSSPESKVNIGSFVHGYLWSLIEKFEIDITRVGNEVQKEILRRKEHGLWLDAIQIPPLPLEQVMSAATLPQGALPPLPLLQQESIKPFDSRSTLVEQIAIHYDATVQSPPNSPPTSPGKVFSFPVLTTPIKRMSSGQGLPRSIREAMLTEWTRESCIATAEKESAKTVSLAGSRSGTNNSARQKYLGIGDQSPRNGSPGGAYNSRQPSPHSNLANGTDEQSPDNQRSRLRRKASGQDAGSHTPRTSSGQNPTLRVDDLKKVLTGGSLRGRFAHHREASPLAQARFSRKQESIKNRRSMSSASESMATAEGFESASEGNFSRDDAHMKEVVKPQEVQTSRPLAPAKERRPSQSSRPGSRPRSLSIPRSSQEQKRRSGYRPPSSSSSANEDPVTTAKALRGDLVTPVPASPGQPDTDVPPVPPLPNNWPLQTNTPVGQMPLPIEQMQEAHHPPHSAPMEKLGVHDDHFQEMPPSVIKRQRKSRGVDVNALLGSIDAVTSSEADYLS